MGEQIAQVKIHEIQDVILENIHNTLSSEEMTKPKFPRAVFETFEEILPYISSPASPKALESIKAIKADVNALGERDSNLNTIVTRLVEQIDNRLEVLDIVALTPTGKTNTAKTSSS